MRISTLPLTRLTTGSYCTVSLTVTTPDANIRVGNEAGACLVGGHVNICIGPRPRGSMQAKEQAKEHADTPYLSTRIVGGSPSVEGPRNTQ